jgi:hypothetical protein
MSIRPAVVALIAVLCLPPVFIASAQQQDAAVPAPVPDWYLHGIIAGLLDPTQRVLANVMTLPRARDALAAIGARDPEQRKTVLDTLVRVS